MKITDLLDKSCIELNAKVSGKKEAIEKLIALMEKSGKIKDVEAYKKLVFAREKQGTTGVGKGVAIPHGKGDCVITPGLSAMVVKDGVDFEALDGAPVELIFLIAAPDTKENVHLSLLSKLATLLMDEAFVEQLKNATSEEEFLNIIEEAEKKKEQKESTTVSEQQVNKKLQSDKKILAVTACPTGIAHTYMAAESLEKEAKKLGVSIKVETRGSGGAKNVLTEEEIEKADAIIVAADTKVPMDRFHGKKVMEVQVSDGIHKAEQLIKKAISGDIPIYQAKEGEYDQSVKNTQKSGKGHQIYKHLMNGISHMLPFVVGGGILIAVAFLIDSLTGDISSTDEIANLGSISRAASFFKGLGDLAFGFMLPILSGYIAMSIGDRPGLAVGFVGGALAKNGSSGFLGALVIGFIAGYIILLLKKVFSKLPNSLEGIKPVLLYPVLGILLVGVIMTFIIEPPVGALNTSLNNALKGMDTSSKVILGMLLGGMMAVDLGGPVNKAAYVFGTASIAAGNYEIMAAVMMGGMIPPCAIALATILFKNKFTESEKKAGPTNFIMGLAFISEGAIPFAAADPIRVLPSLIVGSAVGGALSMIFNCTLMAPHGGIFVFPVVGNPLLYLLSLIIGSIISALLLGLLKKPVSMNK
ncbi:PTS fructose transporter subunit IIABC [Garciella nitratireducens]|uniref:PTS fructose transporter subunit IIABC n=1 Tax=Garciella nitratireducens TaxID=218205 RepID=UPI001BD30D80|nr:fructose-specific PTS transporter subunit EIIC [Garciella nitratireducens]